MRRIQLVSLLLICSCDSIKNQDSADTGAVDFDQDGISSLKDCNDLDASIGATIEWFLDQDGDGFGDDTDMQAGCEQPDGYVQENGDCDDANADIYPGAWERDCTDPIDYNCDGSVGFTDNDADGSAACEDCNDNDSTTYPGATEVCDNIDNDCDGTIDDYADDASIWFGDADSDGYGGQQFVELSCSQPVGYVDNSDDCNDLNPNSHPGATEICDEDDNDCDTEVDEGVKDAFYLDLDGDGYGDESQSQQACAQPTGYSANSDDCDDSDAATSPASFEICDEIDNNCDGAIDDESTIDGTLYYADADGDGYGSSTNTLNACELPASGYTDDDTDCNDTNATISPGQSETCDAVDNDCDGTVDEDDAIDATTWYIDIDGDGYGSEDTSTIACNQPSGYVDNDSDCNDSDVNVWDSCATGLTQAEAGITCASILADYSSSTDGSYWIDPDNDGDVTNADEVYCDMTNGGWTYAAINTPFSLTFTGATQSIVTPATNTEVFFELYGASGGAGYNYVSYNCGSGSKTGGLGGYASGSNTYNTATTLYIEVGGQGDDGGCADQGTGYDRSGGYNGGGDGSQGGSGGGGATDVRTTSGDLSSRILVAGGGGGCGSETCICGGGDGGALSGSDGETSCGPYGYGGSQTAGGSNSSANSSSDGSLGEGGDCQQVNDEGGGGGGYYGGSAGGTSNAPGGGGSSYYGGMTYSQATISGLNVGNGYAEYIFR